MLPNAERTRAACQRAGRSQRDRRQPPNAASCRKPGVSLRSATIVQVTEYIDLPPRTQAAVPVPAIGVGDVLMAPSGRGLRGELGAAVHMIARRDHTVTAGEVDRSDFAAQPRLGCGADRRPDRSVRFAGQSLRDIDAGCRRLLGGIAHTAASPPCGDGIGDALLLKIPHDRIYTHCRRAPTTMFGMARLRT